MGGNLLSDAALHQVRELIRQESGRARGERTWEAPKLHVGPEVFLAYHAAGIAAMSGSTPGSAECDLYEIGTDGTLAALMMDGTTNNQRTVRNASASAVGAGYFPVWRDKLGTWWATASSSSTLAHERFRCNWIDSAATNASTISTGTQYYLKAAQPAGDLTWLSGNVATILTQTSGTDPMLRIDTAGDYLIVFRFYLAFGSWTSTTPDCALNIWHSVAFGVRPSGGAYAAVDLVSAGDSFTVTTEGGNEWTNQAVLTQRFAANDELRVLWQAFSATYPATFSSLSCRLAFQQVS